MTQATRGIVPPIAAVPDDPQTPANETVTAFVNPAIISGPTFVNDANMKGHRSLLLGGVFPISPLGLGAGADNTDLTADSYSFQVRIILGRGRY